MKVDSRDRRKVTLEQVRAIESLDGYLSYSTRSDGYVWLFRNMKGVCGAAEWLSIAPDGTIYSNSNQGKVGA